MCLRSCRVVKNGLEPATCRIDVECGDADLFVMVVNAESTIMMREKDFFVKVAANVARPNVVVLFNRFD